MKYIEYKSEKKFLYLESFPVWRRIITPPKIIWMGGIQSLNNLFNDLETNGFINIIDDVPLSNFFLIQNKKTKNGKIINSTKIKWLQKNPHLLYLFEYMLKKKLVNFDEMNKIDIIRSIFFRHTGGNFRKSVLKKAEANFQDSNNKNKQIYSSIESIVDNCDKKGIFISDLLLQIFLNLYPYLKLLSS